MVPLSQVADASEETFYDWTMTQAWLGGLASPFSHQHYDDDADDNDGRNYSEYFADDFYLVKWRIIERSIICL